MAALSAAFCIRSFSVRSFPSATLLRCLDRLSHCEDDVMHLFLRPTFFTTKLFFNEKRVVALPHPPGLTPSDFWLFPQILKIHFEGYNINQELKWNSQ
jgi:hypothetical protein